MNNQLIDRHDERVTDLLRRMDKVLKTLDHLEVSSRQPLNGMRFVTDRELSAILRVTRKALYEYRMAGVISYYLICGKILYCEAEIRQYLEASRIQSIAEKKLL